jgi:hypothetical protein
MKQKSKTRVSSFQSTLKARRQTMNDLRKADEPDLQRRGILRAALIATIAGPASVGHDDAPEARRRLVGDAPRPAS